MTTFKYYAGTILLVIFFFSIFRACFGKVEVTESTALAVSHQYVRQKLISPSTAEFATESKSTITQSGNSYYIVSYVDAKNAFGTPIRKNYTCRVMYFPKEEKWSLISMDIE
ncbi:TPA: hypothetical protein DD449_02540 [Candidatus Berkelbacteria bacterium]|nr:hypothetical protein [Candidatus Berkelbacteria bacterium]